MKRHHTIDKFGRSAQFSFEGDAHINVGNKRIQYVADPLEPHETVNRGYLENNFVANASHTSLEARVKNLEALAKSLASKGKSDESLKLSADGKSWDARGFKIANAGLAEELTDVSRYSQTCSFDESIQNFRCGTRTFDLVESSANAPVVVATRVSAFGPLELTEYKNPFKIVMPSSIVRWRPDTEKLTDGYNQELQWDAKKKKFTFKEGSSWNVWRMKKP